MQSHCSFQVGSFVCIHVSPGPTRGVFDATDVLNLPLVEEGDGVDDDPGQCSPKVYKLVHDEAHNTGREDIVLHPEVP